MKDKINYFNLHFKEKNKLDNIDLFIKKIKKKDITNENLDLQIINQQNFKNNSENNLINNIFNNL
jgi:hypothetical protein